ncbi:MAG TPA: choice-of-anchor D domain-containing protein [Jatrophihabitans sp.]|nr:choice-of-anchor D domain-containing protein [Jatrophihabitans sp.]
MSIGSAAPAVADDVKPDGASCLLGLPCFKLSASPGSVDFGRVTVGDSPTRIITLTNIGTGGGRVTRATASPPFDVDRAGCSTRLAPGTSCSLTVSFTPADTGPREGTLTTFGLGTLDGVTESVHLSGTGGSPPQVSVAPMSVNFAQVPVGSTSNSRAVFITNESADSPVRITGASANGPFDVDMEGSCGSVPPGNSCGVNVTFAPKRRGNAMGTLTIKTDVAGSEKVNLSGVGSQDRAALSVRPTSINFGSVLVGRHGAGRTVTVTNNGDGTDAVSTLSVTEPFAASGPGCVSKPLQPGASCSIRVTFTPTAGGDQSGNLRIATVNGGSASVHLSGSGATSAFSVTPRAMAFGEVPVGQRSATKTLRVHNTGDVDVTVDQVTDPGFVIDAAACTGRTLQPGNTCAVRVSFEPTGTGPVADTLVVATSAGRFTVALSGTGTGNHGIGGVHTGPPPPGNVPAPPPANIGGGGGDLSNSGAPSAQALVAGLALLAAGMLMQVAGALRRREAEQPVGNDR